jgi:hypothetical protein
VPVTIAHGWGIVNIDVDIDQSCHRSVCAPTLDSLLGAHKSLHLVMPEVYFDFHFPSVVMFWRLKLGQQLRSIVNQGPASLILLYCLVIGDDDSELCFPIAVNGCVTQ